MIWIYIDSTGEVKCCVNVGNLVRQGNPIDAFVVIEGMNGETASNVYELDRVAFIRPDSAETIYTQSTVGDITKKTFELGNPSQANSYFIGGNSYNGYPVHVSAEATSFEGNGGHTILLFICVDGEEHENLGRLTLYVNPAYGKKPTSLTHDDMNTLLSMISNIEGSEIESSLILFQEELPDGSVYTLTFNQKNGNVLNAGDILAPRGPQGLQGPQGEQGPQGVQGPAGNDGIAVPANCLFTLYVDRTTGKLMASYPEGGTDPSTYLSIDDSTGKLIYTY